MTEAQIAYIQRNVVSLQVEDLRVILSLIMKSNVPDEKILEKGLGVEVRYDSMSAELIESIFNFIKCKEEEKAKPPQ